MDAIIHILSDARGIYIPRDFVTDDFGNIAKEHCNKWGVNQDDALLLALGPETDFYWDIWEHVLNNAEFKADDGNAYKLYQDGNLWGICWDKMTDEEKHNFGFED